MNIFQEGDMEINKFCVCSVNKSDTWIDIKGLNYFYNIYKPSKTHL